MTNLSGTNLNNGAAVGPQGEGMDSPSNFPKYPAYKDSGVEWLGLVPEHWVVTRLGRVTEIESGYPFPAEQFVDDGIPVVRMSDLKEGQVSLDSIKRVEARFVPVKAMAKADDLLIGLSGSISNFAQVSASDLPLAVNQRVGIIRADDSIEATIAKYFVISKSFICQIESAVPETTILNISMEQVRSCALAWPPRFEQTQIARFLDHETARIDALIEEQQRLIELLKEKRQAVISHAVTKGLDPTAPMKDSGVEWLGEVPEHWVVTRLGRVTEIESGYPFPAEQFVDDGIPVVRMSDLKEGQVSLDSIKRVEARFVPVKAMAKADDLLIGLSGSISNFAQVSASDLPLAVNQRVGIIRADDSIEATIAKYFVISKSFFCQIESAVPETTILNISMEQVRSCALAWPPRFEQTQIARFLDHETARIDALIEEANTGVGLLQERRSALISAAVTGKIDVRNWQPPASVQAPEVEQEAV